MLTRLATDICVMCCSKATHARQTDKYIVGLCSDCKDVSNEEINDTIGEGNEDMFAVKVSDKKPSIIPIIIQRTLSFPFFLGIAIVGSLVMFWKWIFNFVRFGGESIAYTDKMNRKTIQDVFVKLDKMQSREQL